MCETCARTTQNEESKKDLEKNLKKRAREQRIDEMLHSKGTLITKRSKLLIENTIDRDKKERSERKESSPRVTMYVSSTC